MIISASALKRCGYARLLNRTRPRSARNVAAIDRGTMFHAGVEQWARTGIVPEVADMEVQGWLELLAVSWTPPPGAEFEAALGLSHDGSYVPVEEKPPGSHIYVPAWGAPKPLVTAGRADVVWLDGDQVANVLDWKTGVWPPEHPATNLQLWALGIAAAGRFGARGARVGLGYVRDGAFDWSDPVERGSDAWAERVDDVLTAAKLDESPRPDLGLCTSCWERKACAYAITEAA